jgi:hypothetical protein
MVRNRPFILQGGMFFVSFKRFYSDNTRVKIIIFYPEFNIRLYDKNSESQFNHQCFERSAKICEPLNMEVKKPRICGRQIMRDIVEAEGPEEYFRKSITVSFLSLLVLKIKVHRSNACVYLYIKHNLYSKVIYIYIYNTLRSDGLLHPDPTNQSNILNKQFQSVFSEKINITKEQFNEK